MTIHKELIEIPIYERKVWLVVTDTMRKETKKWEYLFGPDNDTAEYFAVCLRNDLGTFGLFFKPDAAKDIGTIAHEVFHLTHRILEYHSCNFDSGHHEQGAVLNEYLMKTVTSKLAKIKRKLK